MERTMTAKSRLFGLSMAVYLLGAPVLAQETRASLSGIVADASGSVLPGVAMRLTNVETGIATSTLTNDAGLYRFLFLIPGRYKLVATMAGFKTFERDNIELAVAEDGTLPV